MMASRKLSPSQISSAGGSHAAPERGERSQTWEPAPLPNRDVLRWALASVLILSVVVLVTYTPALKLGFYGDDYAFLEVAGRSSLSQYLSFYFDPRVQTGWYRPMQGMLFGIEYALFGGNPLGYHLMNVLVHLGNCLLLSAIAWRVSKRGRVAFVAALLYAGLPLYSVAVFWPGDVDFLLTFFYLLSLFFWVLHLQEGQRWFGVAAFTFFLLALLTKEFGVTLPVMLFLADRLLLRERISRAALLRRYASFLVVWLIYLPMEYLIQSRSVLTNLYGYGVGSHVLANFVGYLAALAFPWGLPDPANYVWLVIAAVLFGYVLLAKKSGALLFLALGGGLTFLPVISFPWFFTRYLYLSVMVSAILGALLFDLGWQRLACRAWFAPSAGAALALIIFGNGLGVADSAAAFAELARQTRVPFRDIAQRHRTFPEDTYLYFINPSSPTAELSGMFFLRYGHGISVASNVSDGRRANLRDHKTAYVIYFDEQRRTREVLVDNSLVVETRPPLPTDFTEPIRLVGHELASAKVKRGEAIVLILYWQATGKIDRNYTVFLYLVDAATGKILVGYDQDPRKGNAPTSSWKPGVRVVDARVLPLPEDTPPGSNYRLEIGLYDPLTMQRLSPVDGRGQPVGDKVMIEPIRIVE